MMYPRLYLARNLLRDDGVIFVSIDDNEVENLRKLMNEVFGEENFMRHCHLAKVGTHGNTHMHLAPTTITSYAVARHEYMDQSKAAIIRRTKQKTGNALRHTVQTRTPRGPMDTRVYGRSKQGTLYSRRDL